jgi:hypothetical protein
LQRLETRMEVPSVVDQDLDRPASITGSTFTVGRGANA